MGNVNAKEYRVRFWESEEEDIRFFETMEEAQQLYEALDGKAQIQKWDPERLAYETVVFAEFEI